MKTSLNWLRYAFLLGLRSLLRVLYRFEVNYINNDNDRFQGVRLAILLNHTSLFEPIYLGTMPNKLVKRLAFDAIFPGAQETLDRPIAGSILKLLAPQVISLTRKRDHSWDNFLDKVHLDALILFMPEGRMKRRSGLDKHNRPMTLRSGVVDLLSMLGTGKLLICYSGGLHHVQAPGEGFPKLFKSVRCAYETIDIAEYLAAFRERHLAEVDLRQAILDDLEERRDKICPSLTNH